MDDGREVAGRNGVTQEILSLPQERPRLRTGREPDLVALGGERPDERRFRWEDARNAPDADGTSGIRDRRRSCHERTGGRSASHARSSRFGDDDTTRQLAHGRRYIRLRKPPGEQLLDVVLALAAGGGQELLVVFHRQVGSQKADRRQAEQTLGQHRHDRRKQTCRARALDPIVGSIFGEAEHRPAIREHRLVSRAFVEPTGIELGQVHDERGGGLALPIGQ